MASEHTEVVHEEKSDKEVAEKKHRGIPEATFLVRVNRICFFLNFSGLILNLCTI